MAPDYSFEDLQRMAAQTHPQILPGNVRYLERVARDAYERVEQIESNRSYVNHRVIRSLGITAATTLAVEAPYVAARELAGTHGTLDKYIIGIGIGIAALQAGGGWLLNKAGRRITLEARNEHAALALLHQTAHERAVNMGLIQSEE